MPRPSRPSAVAVALTVTVCCAALGPAALGTALAAAAGTLFEAAPFVLVAEALPRGPLRHLATTLGCGCGRVVPGALSPIALALCWLTFGPAVTLARGIVGFAVLACTLWSRRRSHRDSAYHPPFDALSELLALAPWAAAAALLGGALSSVAPTVTHSPEGFAVATLAGIALGYLAPCGTVAVAIAAALLPHAPIAAWSVLLTGGLVPRAQRPGRSDSHSDDPRHEIREERDRRNVTLRAAVRRFSFARLALGAAATALAATGPHGLVNPRLGPLLWLAAALGVLGVRRATREAAALLVPAIMFGALLAATPPPPYAATETELGEAFPGERLAFTGVAQRRASVTILERFAITCCRADASPVAVRLTSPLDVPNGSWVEAHGTLAQSREGLVLRLATWRRIGAPQDPFIYR